MISPVSTISRASATVVFDVVDRLEHQEQGVVVAVQLRPLVGVHGVLDGQRVQAENLGHRLHLVVVGFVQADPDEGRLAACFEFADLRQGRRVRVLAGQPGSIDVDGAVDHRPGDGDVDAFGVDTGGAGPAGPGQRRRQRAERRHDPTSPDDRRWVRRECYARTW